jgi:hypothetical protein
MTAWGLRFLAISLSGETERAENAVTSSVRDSIWMDFHLPWVIAEGYAVLDEKEEALKWLSRAVDKGVFNYPVLNKLDPLLENIRGETEFKKLIEKVKSSWENFNPLFLV